MSRLGMAPCWQTLRMCAMPQSAIYSIMMIMIESLRVMHVYTAAWSVAVKTVCVLTERRPAINMTSLMVTFRLDHGHYYQPSTNLITVMHYQSLPNRLSQLSSDRRQRLSLTSTLIRLSAATTHCISIHWPPGFY